MRPREKISNEDFVRWLSWLERVPGIGAIAHYPSAELLQWLAERGYPTAGFRSQLAGNYIYEDDDPRLTPPYRKARAKLMTAEDFEEVLSPNTTEQERAALFRVLVDGWKIRDGARESGLSFYAFEQRVLRMRRDVELLPRIPDDERFQPYAFDKSLQRRRAVIVERPTRPRNPNSAWHVDE